MNDDANKWAAEAATNSVGAIEPSWWYEITSDGDWIIGSGNRGFALVNDESQAQIIVDRHNRAAQVRECICEEGFGMNLSCPAHASEDVIDLIVGDLVRETNIFPNQVQRAKELIRERLSGKQ